MHKIYIPQSNPNDEYVFLAEWKFENNQLVKKGDHLLSVETSKVVEEIYSDQEGYLEKLYNEKDKVKIGKPVAILNKKKVDLKEIKKTNSSDLIFTKKAKVLLEKYNINPNKFDSKQIIKEKDIIDYVEKNNIKPIEYKNNIKLGDQLIILMKANKSYHAAIYLEDEGMTDLSLMGSNITKVEDYNFGGCKCIFFELKMPKKINAQNFFHKPALLTEKIIKKEKSARGWSMKAESADYILKFRNKRSKDIDDMNCIEWLVYGIELGGLEISDDVLTASTIYNWAKNNLVEVKKNSNLLFFKKYY